MGHSDSRFKPPRIRGEVGYKPKRSTSTGLSPIETQVQMRARHRRELERLALESRTCPRCGHVTED